MPENTAVTAPVGVGQPRAVAPTGSVTDGSVAKVASGAVGNWQATTCAFVRLIELVNDSELTAAASAQLLAPRYEPETLSEPEPMASKPENTAVTAPVGDGQPRAVTPTGNVTDGSVAKVASGAVGN